MLGFQNTMIGVFGEFLRGGGVVRIYSPTELYLLFDILRDTTYNFFNLNKTSDAQLIAMVGSRNPRYMDLSRDRLTTVQRTEEVILRERCIYYHLKDNYGFEGFPAYFHVRETWDDNLYSKDPEMMKIMGVPDELMHQVEFFYESGSKPLVINEFNPSTLSESIKIMNSPYRLQLGVNKPDDPNAGFNADLLINSLNDKIAYPVCVLTDPVVAMIKGMSIFTDAQAKTDFYVNHILSDAMNYIITVDDPYQNLPQEAINGLLATVRGITMGYQLTALELDNMGQLKDMDEYFSYLAFGDPTKMRIPEEYLQDENPFPLYFYYDRQFGVPHLSKEPPEGFIVIIYSKIEGVVHAISERFSFIINMLSPILMSFPMRSTVVPPKYVHSIRDVMFSDMVTDAQSKE